MPEPEQQQVEAASGVASGRPPSISIRNYMASQHLWNARREAWLCRNREETLLDEQNVDRPHRSHAMAAIWSAVAFLEALVNEVGQDAAEVGRGQSKEYIEGIPDVAIATMRELWTGKEKAERMLSSISKFQVALVCAGHQRMERGAEPYQSVDILINLRNDLVHFKPQ
ncbi:hypothetical protein [Mycobacterium sp.]|uniref:hypothetical protein n=1 Tax=Mycobacterium sp. TaxID=1785 RepID=UPI001276573B|nr:hypothetical protein [Mycobacterium sp.]KAA8963989.1 MAG: hypothetical protein F6Q13_10425 [Mycobacterium sp.]